MRPEISGGARLSRRRVVVGLGGVGLLWACTPGFPPPTGAPGVRAASRLVRRPGIVLVDPVVRRAELRAAPEARALCAADDLQLRSWPPPGPIGPRDGHATDTRLNPLAWLVMRAAAASLVDTERPSAAELARALDRWARADALLLPPTADATAYFAVNRFLFPTIVGWALIRDAPEVPASARRRIEAWLGRLAEASRARLEGQRPDEITARNNHAYLAASAITAWGALAGEDSAFALGLEVYRRALGEMRADGSLPLETGRGARALWYQRQAIASLVALAELAALQGHDLFGLEREGRSLHRAIRFLLDAIDEPERVLPYAAENRNPGPSADWRRQDLSFLSRRGHDRHYMAWVEIYRARFPDREETRRLEALLRRDGDPRPLVDEFAGGNLSCLRGPLSSPRLSRDRGRDPWPGHGTAG
ncbi:MAG: alginate lyase family protein [Geminicoccaceae bacterium]